jgi:hypothetical protein
VARRSLGKGGKSGDDIATVGGLKFDHIPNCHRP